MLASLLGCIPGQENAVDVSLRIEAKPDNALYVKDKTAQINVLSNDVGVFKGVTARVVDVPQNGSAWITYDGIAEYEPSAGYCGSDQFVYGIDDGVGGYSEATVALEGVGCSLFEAIDDQLDFVQGDVVQVDVKSNDLGELSLVSVYIIEFPLHGRAKVDETGAVEYESSSNYCGEDYFNYALVGQGSYSEATVTLHAQSCAQSFIAVNDNVTTQQGESVQIPVLENDVGDMGDGALYLSVTPTSGVVSLQGDVFSYTSNESFCGTDSFSYTVLSGESYSAAKVTIEVQNCQIALAAVSDTFGYSFGQPTSFNVLSNDHGVTEEAMVSLKKSPSGGQVTVYDDGTMLYVPRPGFCSIDTFTYRVIAGTESSEADVTLSPQNCREQLKAYPDVVEYNQGESVTVDVLLNDVGYLEGDNVYLLETPQYGTVKTLSFGVLEYTPLISTYCGMDSFTYVLDDGFGRQSEAQVTLATVGCGKLFVLTWDASPSPNVAGYRTYVGQESGVYTSTVDVGNVLQYGYVVTEPGTYYFAVSTISTQGVESELSDEKVVVY